jgi:signal transduction histidine kinase
MKNAVVLALLGWTAVWAQAQTQGPSPITRIAEIRALTREQAAQARPVRVRGVVNLAFGSHAAFILADDSAGMYVSGYEGGNRSMKVFENGKAVTPKVIKLGLEVEVVGVTSPGGYAPVILATEVRILGQLPLSPPQRVSLDHLQEGGEDAQRVRLDSLVVRSVLENQPGIGRRVLRACSASGHYILIVVEPAPWNESAKLVDAEVMVTGIVLPLFNSRLELTGLRLAVAREEDFEIVKPPPPDVWATPRLEIGALRLFRPAGISPHRFTVEGTVTLIEEDGLVIQDQGRGVAVKNTPSSGLQIGDRVRIAAFVAARQPVAFLTYGLVEKLASGTPPEALATTPEAIIQNSKDNTWRGWGNLPDDYDHRLVRLEGKLISEPPAGVRSFIVQTAAGTTLTVNFAAGSPRLLRPPATGSLLALTGVAVVRHAPGRELPEYIQATDMDLYLRGPGDVQVLRAPSWWDARRLRNALILAAALIVLIMLWLRQLRRMVRQQTERIEQTLRTHHDAELASEAAKRERLRLADDLHDGVHQLLTATAYRLESVIDKTARDPSAALADLGIAQKTLDRSQRELRSILWGIHELATAPPDFAELLTQALSGVDHWPPDVAVVHSSGSLHAIPARAAGSLLLLCQEAVENATRHGHASRVEFTLDATDERLRLTIRDNGCGFDPASAKPTSQGGLGIGNMRRRVAELSGTFTLHSLVGEGVTIRIEIPRKQLSAGVVPKSGYSEV